MIPKTTKVQSVLLCKDYFTKAQARSWIKEHGYKYGKLDETDRQYRFRQEEPEEFQPSSFRTISFRPGVQAVIARPFSHNPGKGKAMAKKKKKASKRKASKRKASKRKASKRKASKRKASKRKASKRKASPKKKRNPGKAKNNSTPKVNLELKPMGKTISSSAPQNLYHAYIKNGRDKMYIGHVTAKNATEAKRKARAYLRKKV